MAIRDDLDRAFPDTPDVFSEAILHGFADGRRHEKRRRALISALSIAAVLALAMSGLWRGLNSGEDRVAAPSGGTELLSNSARVYASLDDAFFHANDQCSGGVEMSLEAARGFGKAACPKCFSGETTVE